MNTAPFDLAYQIEPNTADIGKADEIFQLFTNPALKALERKWKKPCPNIAHQSVVHGITRKYNVDRPVLSGAAIVLSYSRTGLIHEDMPHINGANLEKIKAEFIARRELLIKDVSVVLSFLVRLPKGFEQRLTLIGIFQQERKQEIVILEREITKLLGAWG